MPSGVKAGFAASLGLAAVIAAAAPEACAFELTAAGAASADAVLATIGVNTHFNFLDTPYHQRYEEVRAKLLALGIRQVRDSPNGRIPDLANHGIRTTLLLEPSNGSPDTLRELVCTLNAGRAPDRLAIDAVEGPNEPDQYWARLGHTYGGKGFPEGVVAFQRGLFAAFKRDPRTRALPVIGPTLGLAGAPGAPPIPALAGLAPHVDWGGIHPYPYGGDATGAVRPYGRLRSFERDGTHPSVTLAPDGGVWRGYRAIYGDRPAAATETGYPTDQAHSSEALQARYLPRLYAEYFARGIRRTYVYQLVDGQLDPSRTDPEQSFGLLRADLSERPAYAALAGFVGLLRGERTGCGEPSVPRAAQVGLEVVVSGTRAYPDTARLHHLFLRREGGALLLLLWHEVSGEDASTVPRTALQVDALPVLIRPSHPVRTALHRLTDPLASTAAAREPSPAPVELTVSDAMVVVEFCP